MMNDNLIRGEGMKALIEKLGLLEAERFITLIKRDRFDYAKWREEFYKDKTLEDIFYEAAAFQAKEEEEEKAKKLPAKPVRRTARTPAAKRKTAKQLVPA